MNDMSQPPVAAAAGANSLWAVIGVLGVVVVALASALYFVQNREEALHEANTNGITPAPVGSPLAGVPEPAPAQPRPVEKKQATVKQVPPKAHPAVAAGKPAATAAAPSAAAPAKATCADCGTVTASTPVEREGTGSGTGAVAGGVLGALVGNQVGRGQGKDVATILGAIGGGLAGNAVEKKMKKETVFQVQVRMDDGSTRSFEQAAPVGVGARVRVQGDSLQPLPSGS